MTDRRIYTDEDAARFFKPSAGKSYRPSMPPGPVIQAGVAPGGGTKDFAFYVWRIGHQGPPIVGWLRKGDVQ